MPPTHQFRSGAYDAIHSAAFALLKVGAIHQTTMREFDTTCLNSPENASVVGWVSVAPPTDAN